jgi:hypothetical protein
MDAPRLGSEETESFDGFGFGPGFLFQWIQKDFEMVSLLKANK